MRKYKVVIDKDRPSTISQLLIGAGSAFDITGGQSNVRRRKIITKKISDEEAIASYWQAVGKDINIAIKSFERMVLK